MPSTQSQKQHSSFSQYSPLLHSPFCLSLERPNGISSKVGRNKGREREERGEETENRGRKEGEIVERGRRQEGQEEGEGNRERRWRRDLALMGNGMRKSLLSALDDGGMGLARPASPSPNVVCCPMQTCKVC